MEKNTNSPTWSPFQGTLASWLAREQLVAGPKAAAGQGWPLLPGLSESLSLQPSQVGAGEDQVFAMGSRQGPSQLPALKAQAPPLPGGFGGAWAMAHWLRGGGGSPSGWLRPGWR